MDAFITRKRRRGDNIKGKTTSENKIDREASISPPPKRKPFFPYGESEETVIDLTEDVVSGGVAKQPVALSVTTLAGTIPSPIQLNHVQDLPAKGNVDTLRLSDVLGDPMIRECWLFNYLFDIDFVMYWTP